MGSQEQRERPLAFVTGASSGIGAAFAERLARGGHDLVLVARREARLRDLADRLSREQGCRVEVLAADLVSDEGLRSAERSLEESGADLLINSAGFAGYGPFAERDPQVLEALVRLHVLCMMRLRRAALPAMIGRGAGAVVTIASLLSLSGPVRELRMAPRAAYAGAKSFQLTFMQSLSGELEGTGVRAMVCLPGMVESEFHGPRGLPAGLPVMSAADVAEAALAGLALGEVVCVPGMEETDALDRLGDLQRTVLAAGNCTEPAARYRSAR
jgi:short-subunit dehydrogenase